MSIRSNSFLEYLKTERFFNRIKKSIFSWCIKNREELLNKLNGYDLKYITHIEEIELDYKNVWIDSKENTDIQFDLAVEVYVSVQAASGKHHDIDDHYARIWVTVACEGSLEKKLWDFKIIDVSEFNKTKPKKPLSGDFVPFISKNQYAEYANEILNKFYYDQHPEAKEKPGPIDVNLLAAKMGLKIITGTLSSDGSIFGQIFFKDTVAQIYNKDSQAYSNFLVTKDTMLIDEKATYLRSFGSLNMTIAHECVHAYYHRSAFLFAQMFNDDLDSIQCLVDGGIKNAKNNTTAMWMEIQANALAPYILMPEESFSAYAKSLFEAYEPNSTTGLGNINQIVGELARAYKVTIYAARKRLIDLGYEEAIGSYNWVDGHYVRPYTFKKGSLNYNETYTISYKNIYSKLLTDPILGFRALFSYYVFVENHLCLNHPDYVEKDSSGNLVLSMHALTHMDECCVKFKFSTNNANLNNTDLGTLCYLCRDTSKEIEFDLEIIKNQKKVISDPEFDVRYSVHKNNIAEIKKVISELPFGEIIEYLMEYLSISVKELEIDSGLNERTIRRYVNGENKEPEKRTVVALLRALNLPPEITNIAVKQAGLSFINNNVEDSALLTSMQTLRGCSARDANTFMKKLGFEPLTNDE